MPRVGFETTISVFERPKTLHALDRKTTAIGFSRVIIPHHLHNFHKCYALEIQSLEYIHFLLQRRVKQTILQLEAKEKRALYLGTMSK
jgi:CMP-2-keto-3-deoxyoctulosonic acid synthetase